jgi:ABC-type transport system involved in multi-copper enzyme maturation permease subunit
MTDAGTYRLLTRESLRDAARRRVVPAVIVLCLLTLGGINSCTTCNAQITTNSVDPSSVDILGWVGVSVLGVLALWSITLAGLLASDHLSASLEDGSGLLVLTRPVKRRVFVLSRLSGTLAVSGIATMVIMGGASIMLFVRGDLPMWPALVALLVTLVNCISLAALAMLLSLFLPRIATFLCVVGFVGWTSMANLIAVSGGGLGFVSLVLNDFGPPLLTGVVIPLANWSGQPIDGVSTLNIAFRLGLWVFASVSSLFFVFEKQELVRFESH